MASLINDSETEKQWLAKIIKSKFGTPEEKAEFITNTVIFKLYNRLSGIFLENLIGKTKMSKISFSAMDASNIGGYTLRLHTHFKSRRYLLKNIVEKLPVGSTCFNITTGEEFAVVGRNSVIATRQGVSNEFIGEPNNKQPEIGDLFND